MGTPPADLDEFGEIARLFLPLTLGAPEALGLLDDAAAISLGDGRTLVVTTDTLVAGVHAPLDEAPGLFARKLLRVNLSDLAAKGAEPLGWFLNVAWPDHYNAAARAAFAAGLEADAQGFCLKLFGGDTVSTSGPLTATATLLGTCPAGGFVARAGARAGDVLLVSGTVGDATLGLDVALGRLDSALPAAARAFLDDRYRLPQPRLNLRDTLRAHASACADVSDGLLADAGRIATASGLAVEVKLEAVPLSPAALQWLTMQASGPEARVRLATGGDDYELVCACSPDRVASFQAAAGLAGTPLTVIGRFVEGSGVAVSFGGEPVPVTTLGYRHR